MPRKKRAARKHQKNLIWFLYKKQIIFGAGFLILLAGFFYSGFYHQFKTYFFEATENMVMRSSKIDHLIIEGRHLTDEEILLKTLNINNQTNLLALDIKQIAKTIQEQIPWVTSVRVERRLPGTLYIGLFELVPIARWEEGANKYIIGEQKTVPVGNFIGFLEFPLLKGSGANEQALSFIQYLRAEPSIEKAFDHAIWVGNRRWDIIFDNGMRVLLPENGLALAMSKLAKMIEEENIFIKNIVQIDMRLHDRVIIKQGSDRPAKKP